MAGLHPLHLRWLLTLLGIQAGTALSFAASTRIEVGGTPILIPAPEGFSPVVKQMAAVTKLAEAFVAPGNTQYVQFIAEDQVNKALNGEMPDLARQFYVQSVKTVILHPLSKSQFAEVKETVKNQNQELVKKIQKQMPGFVTDANKKFEKDFDVELGLKFGDMVPLPPHDESGRSMAYSMYVKGSVLGSSGKPEGFRSVVSGAMLHIKAKFILLYAAGRETDLEWTRARLKEWTDAVISANPSDPAAALQEDAPRKRGFDVQRILQSALVGGIIGGVVAALAALKKKKASKQGPKDL